MAKAFWSFYIFCSALTIGSCLNPGFKMYLTNKGLAYLDKVANGEVNPRYFMQNGNETLDKLETIKFQDLTVEIIQMNFDIDKSLESNLLFKPKVGLLHLIDNGTLSVQCRYQTIKNDSDFFVITANGAYLQSTIHTRNTGGRLKLTTEKCKCQIWGLEFELVTPGSLRASLIRTALNDALPDIKKVLQNLVCKFENVSYVEHSLASKFVDFNEAYDILFDKYAYNGSLSDEIQIQNDFLETSHDGGIMIVSQSEDDQVTFINDNNRTNANIFPPEISVSKFLNESDSKKSTHMQYVLMSNYSLNSLLYELWSSGALNFQINEDTIDPTQGVYLQTECGEFGMCASLIIPALGKLYPNGTLDVTLRADTSPTVTILARKIRIVTRGFIGCNVRRGDRREFLFSSDADLVLEIQKFQLSDFSTDIRIADFRLQKFNSSTTEIDESKVTLLINFAKDMFFGVDLSDKFQKTVTVPKMLDYGIDHKSSRVEFLTDVIKISLNYLD